MLVVDDDAGMRSLIADLLRGAGHTAIVAGSGREALALSRAERPDLAIVDVQMPAIGGYEVCRELRSRFGQEIAVMLLSGSRTEPFDRAAGLDLGADDYLLKPFAPDELLARVRALVRRTAARSISARAAGSVMPLTKREADVLSLLAEGHGQKAIARQLVVTEKTVSKHIENVLKKLGAHSRAEAVAVAYRERVIELR